MKFGNDWKEVHSAKCDSDKFTGKLADGEIIAEQPAKVKCARRSKLPLYMMRDYKIHIPECTKCENPCHTCRGTEFTSSTKWNECSKFSVSTHKDYYSHIKNIQREVINIMLLVWF